MRKESFRKIGTNKENVRFHTAEPLIKKYGKSHTWPERKLSTQERYARITSRFNAQLRPILYSGETELDCSLEMMLRNVVKKGRTFYLGRKLYEKYARELADSWGSTAAKKDEYPWFESADFIRMKSKGVLAWNLGCTHPTVDALLKWIIIGTQARLFDCGIKVPRTAELYKSAWHDLLLVEHEVERKEQAYKQYEGKIVEIIFNNNNAACIGQLQKVTVEELMLAPSCPYGESLNFYAYGGGYPVNRSIEKWMALGLVRVELARAKEGKESDDFRLFERIQTALYRLNHNRMSNTHYEANTDPREVKKMDIEQIVEITATEGRSILRKIYDVEIETPEEQEEFRKSLL